LRNCGRSTAVTRSLPALSPRWYSGFRKGRG
jgi:hypothetical protein